MEQRPFHKDIEAVRADVAAMGRFAARQLADGLKSLDERDPDLATRVLARDRDLTDQDIALEARLLELIALHQPMARDLRALGASLKVITYLDRIGRYGYDIAVASLSAIQAKPSPVPRGIILMGGAATRMAERAIEGYEGDDPTPAREAIASDDEVDELYDEVFRACLTYMMQDPTTIRAMTEYLLVARHLERAADNAVKVAEKAIYISTGERRRRPAEQSLKEGGGVGHDQ